MSHKRQHSYLPASIMGHIRDDDGISNLGMGGSESVERMTQQREAQTQ